LGYLAARVGGSIAHGILAGARNKEKRRKMIDELREPITVSGVGRLEGRVADEREALAA
jgi:hypothetical protein